MKMVELRPVRASDASLLFPLIDRTKVTDTILWDGPESLEEFRQALSERAEATRRGEKHVFTILERANGQPVGSASIRPDGQRFRADLGLWLGTPYQDRGYGTQAIGELLDYGFQTLGLQKIDAWVFTGNWASRRAHEKNGFTLEGTVRKAVLKRGAARDEWLLGITQEDYGQRLRDQAEPVWIVHLVTREDWQAAREIGVYRADSLETEGFIHFSRPEQVVEVANRYYIGQEDLELLWVDLRKARPELRWEASGGQTYPHLYGPLNLDAVCAASPFHPDSDGVFRQLPDEP